MSTKLRSKPPQNVQYPSDDELEHRAHALVSRGFSRSRWIDFMLVLMREDRLKVGVYEAATTRSKYVYVHIPNKGVFKVRFSNHRPAVGQQLNDDSDFYVGVSNGKVTNTDQALAAVRAFIDSPGHVAAPLPTSTERVIIECSCGITFQSLPGAKRKCNTCGRWHRAGSRLNFT